MSKIKTRWVVLLVASMPLVFGCSSRPVVGVNNVSLYVDRSLTQEKRPLESGIQVTLVSEQDNLLQVRTQDGVTGWVRKCWMCSLSEMRRREASNEVPENVACIGAEGEKRFLYGGRVRIQNNRPTVGAGDAFWLDTTMKGKEYSIGTKSIIGDPSVLVLYKSSGTLVQLPIWSQ